MAEESFRNIKTILSLGAQNKFFSKYAKAVKDCCKQAERMMVKCGFWSAMNLFTSRFANSVMYLSVCRCADVPIGSCHCDGSAQELSHGVA